MAEVRRLLDRFSPDGDAAARPAAVQAGKGAAARPQARPSSNPLVRLQASWRRISSGDRLEGLLPVAIIGLVLLAAVASTLPIAGSASAANRPQPVAVAVGGGNVPDAVYGEGDGPLASDSSDLYFGDGTLPNTLQNPGKGTNALLVTYTVRGGDTLTNIAGRFGLVPSTIYWANKASIADIASLRVGQKLLIPPMDGLIVTVGAKDTLSLLATRYKITTQDIIDANNLPEPSVTAGQILIMPGASGGAMPKSKTALATVGGWKWPVGGDNYISQLYWSGHHALDIAAPYGTPVYAAASGTVVYAGWRSYNQGGNVIWIRHGTKLYSTYNHLSAWSVKVGQRVVAGQKIGSIGTSGMATGPHLHFEVWLGMPWAAGTNNDTVNPCRYLAGC